jgi:hypothetical protein
MLCYLDKSQASYGFLLNSDYEKLLHCVSFTQNVQDNSLFPPGFPTSAVQ